MIKKNNKINKDLAQMEVGNDYYFKEENLNIRIKEYTIEITDISNSLRWGKTTDVYELSFEKPIDKKLLTSIQAIMDFCGHSLKDIYDLAVLNTIVVFLAMDFCVMVFLNVKNKKCVNVYSPFVEMDNSRIVIPKKVFGRWQLVKFLIADRTDVKDLEAIRDIIETPYYEQKTNKVFKIEDNVLLTYVSKLRRINVMTKSKKEELSEVA
ncbi:hypothetical protein HZF24_05045 [Sedimentibacter hydroxybenzoicus DSM 7310]|uniref:Uncharacterized protein n=1 Tax=Sedimentibacter hydroxybenzoicus DSM 7310 TaxID=1123245 RepID=A0A974BIG9_SEDHY|nr:hypothetical protein [Sedimentibacter hydroxybenzoicus]NYB73501.1 hypothetical protein [Sedimentibacter hydroxybenzoicus DSM 7310]